MRYPKDLQYTRYTRAQVSGNGVFPLDMLRYDSCWPHGQLDAIALVSQGQRSVTVARWSHSKTNDGWNAARWQSFGWSLKKMS